MTWWKPLNGNQHDDNDGDGERVSTSRVVSVGDVTRSHALPEGSVWAVCGHSIMQKILYFNPPSFRRNFHRNYILFAFNRVL